MSNFVIAYKISLIIISCLIIVVLLHELTHFVIYKFFGYKVLSVKVFCFCLGFGKFTIDFSLPVGAVIVDCHKIDTTGKGKIFNKHLKINIIITYIIQVLEIGVACFISVVIPDFYTFIIATAVSVLNICIFVSALIDGDLQLLISLFRHSTPRELLEIMMSSELPTGFNNDYIFDKANFIISSTKSFNDNDIMIVNYYLDYNFFHSRSINENFRIKLIESTISEKYKLLLTNKMALFKKILKSKDENNITDYVCRDKCCIKQKAVIDKIKLSPIHKQLLKNKFYFDMRLKVYNTRGRDGDIYGFDLG